MRFVKGLALASIITIAIPSAPVLVMARGASVVRDRSLVITGVVRDLTTAAPVPGATITCTTAAALQAGTGLTRVITNDVGRYRLVVSVADTTQRITIAASRVGYMSAAASAPVPTAGRDSLTLDIGVTPGIMSLEATTTSATGDPAIGVKMPMAVTKLDASQMPVPNFTNGALSIGGKVAGVTMTMGSPPPGSSAGSRDTEEYAAVHDNHFVSVRETPLSTFSANVDRASYSNVRRFIRNGQLPPRDAVRIEELINYFHYEYPAPKGADPVAISTEVAQAPWNRTHQILRVALQTAPIETAALPPNNLVFLIDVSGSMEPAERLPLAKQGFRMLVEQLREQDRVAIVTYAGEAGIALPSTSGSNKARIFAAIDRLQAGGSTAGGAGLQLAYDVASRNFIQGGNNRVILATDGDFNVGISNTADLVRFVEGRRGEGIALTALGFGMGNYKDDRIKQLADHGNGNHAYIDDLAEVRKVFVHEMGATLVTVAKDVKLQVEFNPATVQAYRLIGYENETLQSRDFIDDRKDAGELGAGHSVTALYEIVPAGVALDVDVGTVPTLRYGDGDRTTAAPDRRVEVANVSVRYQLPTSDTSRLLQHPVTRGTSRPSDDMRFAMAVAGYGMLLRNSASRGSYSFEDVLTLGRGALGPDREQYRSDFITLVQATRSLVSQDRQR